MMLSGSTMSWDMPLSEYDCSVYDSSPRAVNHGGPLSPDVAILGLYR